MPPGLLRAEAADSARESIAGAASVAASLSGPEGAAILASARDAFTTSMNVVAVIVAVVAVALSAVAFTQLRSAGSAAGSSPGEGGRADEAAEQLSIDP